MVDAIPWTGGPIYGAHNQIPININARLLFVGQELGQREKGSHHFEAGEIEWFVMPMISFSASILDLLLTC